MRFGDTYCEKPEMEEKKSDAGAFTGLSYYNRNKK